MNLDLKEDENEKFVSQELKWKEMLYELFYEIKSEILGCKIEIDEDEYQENVRAITIPKLVNYLHDSIKILIVKKIDDSKQEQREIDKKFYTNDFNFKLTVDEKNQYENIIRKLESRERFLSRIIFKKELQKNALENKVSEYMEMEDEFEEMKTKLKYEEGRFLKNDRKENEIIILRGENSNLKQSIQKHEEKITDLDKEILNKNKKIGQLQKELNNLKEKIKDIQKQYEILNANYINININNVNPNNKNGTINNTNDNNNKNNKKKEENQNIIKNKMLCLRKINKAFNQGKTFNYTKNESLEKSKSELLNKNKYFANNMNKNNSNNNIKLNNTVDKNKNFKFGIHKKLNQININEIPMPIFNNLINMNNSIINHKNILSGVNSVRSSSTKKQGYSKKIINYKYFL